MIAFVVAAGQLLVALIESYFVISAAIIFLGFGGSRWTQDFVQKYLGYAIAIGVTPLHTLCSLRVIVPCATTKNPELCSKRTKSEARKIAGFVHLMRG